jgi:hypothetical protein
MVLKTKSCEPSLPLCTFLQMVSSFPRPEARGIQNELSNPHASVFRDRIASSLCKEYQALCFACRESCSKVLFHKLFNTTVEIAERAFTVSEKSPNTVILSADFARRIPLCLLF